AGSVGWRLGDQPGVYTLDVSVGALKAAVTARALAWPQSLQATTDPTASGPLPLGSTLSDSLRIRLLLPGGLPAAGYRLTLARSFIPSPSYQPLSTVTDSRGMASVFFGLPSVVGLYTLTIGVAAYPDVRHSFTVSVFGRPALAGISAGDAHTCASMPDESVRGSVLCWGRNAQGELGDSTTTRRLTPVLALIPAPSYFLRPPVPNAGNAV